MPESGGAYSDSLHTLPLTAAKLPTTTENLHVTACSALDLTAIVGIRSQTVTVAG